MEDPWSKPDARTRGRHSSDNGRSLGRGVEDRTSCEIREARWKTPRILCVEPSTAGYVAIAEARTCL
jgi:hypothetical protein